MPVDSINWGVAATFCIEHGLSLPTEAQWEYACRAGTTSAYAFGEALLPEEANFGEHVSSTVPIDSYEPNSFGLYNMHGNVSEWCKDALTEDMKYFEFTGFYKSPHARGPDPVVECLAWNQVSRGGCWKFEAQYCRSASGGGGDPILMRSNIMASGLQNQFGQG